MRSANAGARRNAFVTAAGGDCPEASVAIDPPLSSAGSGSRDVAVPTAAEGKLPLPDMAFATSALAVGAATAILFSGATKSASDRAARSGADSRGGGVESVRARRRTAVAAGCNGAICSIGTSEASYFAAFAGLKETSIRGVIQYRAACASAETTSAIHSARPPCTKSRNRSCNDELDEGGRMYSGGLLIRLKILDGG